MSQELRRILTIIVNADDFGISPDVNKAIVTCFEEGLISSTSIMANMPAFDEACDLAFRGSLEKEIGIHLNLTEGTPLTDSMKANRNFCNDDGYFCCERHPILLSSLDKRSIIAEFEAQIRKCNAAGIHITHLDSHEHVHTEWGIFSAIRPILKKYQILRIRPSANVHRVHLFVKCYKWIFNRRLSRGGFASVDLFDSLDTICGMSEERWAGTASLEIMVHPGFTADGKLIDRIEGDSMVPKLKASLRGMKIQPYSALAIHSHI